MIYRRGRQGIYWYRFRFAGRMIHESARTPSKTVAREAERNRRRDLVERINGIRKRGLPPTFDLRSSVPPMLGSRQLNPTLPTARGISTKWLCGVI